MIWISVPTTPRLGFSVRKKARGFSLVEVAIALGIVAFTVVALLGLMSVGLDSARRSAEDTVVATIAKDILATIRTNSYDSLRSETLYFDYEGNRLPSSSNGYFQCDLLFTNNNAPLNGVSNQSRRLRLSFIWPPESAKTNEVFETVLAEF